MLRAGNAVVGIWNEAFDPDGLPPTGGTTVPGVERTTIERASARGRP
jgi:type IV secretion system protein VirB9